MKTFSDFMDTSSPGISECVDEHGFETFCVAKGWRGIDGRTAGSIIITTLVATRPGHGSFKRLIRKIEKHWPCWVVWLENVSTVQFERGLRKMGFTAVENQPFPCYWKQV